MEYTPPKANELEFNLVSYEPPKANQLEFDLADVAVVDVGASFLLNFI